MKDERDGGVGGGESSVISVCNEVNVLQGISIGHIRLLNVVYVLGGAVLAFVVRLVDPQPHAASGLREHQ